MPLSLYLLAEGDKKKYMYFAKARFGARVLTICMLKEVRMITVMHLHLQNRIFIGSVFQIEVSDLGTKFWNSVCLGSTCI